MTPDEIMEAIEDFADGEDVIRFSDLHDALIGYCTPWIGGNRPTRLVYSAAKCLKIYMERDGMTDEQAMEHLTTNVEGGYLGLGTPIIMYDF